MARMDARLLRLQQLWMAEGNDLHIGIRQLDLAGNDCLAFSCVARCAVRAGLQRQGLRLVAAAQRLRVRVWMERHAELDGGVHRTITQYTDIIPHATSTHRVRMLIASLMRAQGVLLALTARLPLLVPLLGRLEAQVVADQGLDELDASSEDASDED